MYTVSVSRDFIANHYLVGGDWGSENEALPVLSEASKDKTDKARLFAVIALNKIGEKARPLLPQIKILLKDSDNYVQRVAQTTIEQLEGK